MYIVSQRKSVPEAAKEQTTTLHLGRQTTALNLNVDISEIENENDEFHSEDEVDISEVDCALAIDHIEMVEK
jgi:hypothetical protein